MLTYPIKYVWISRGPAGHGYTAYDFGWESEHEDDPDNTGPNALMYAQEDGIVLYTDNSKSDTPDGATYGNRVDIYYPSEDVTILWGHLKKDSLLVKPGDTVTQGQPVGRMGNSGNSRGPHLHMEAYRGKGYNASRRIDYLDIMYATSWHVIDPKTEEEYKGKIMKLLIEPTAQDVAHDQLAVTDDNVLRIRTEPSTDAEVKGYAVAGYYDIDEINGDWCKIGDYWLNGLTDVSFIRYAEFTPTDPDDGILQAEVTIDNLHIRTEPSTDAEIVGWAPVGFYNVDGQTFGDGYEWSRIGAYYIAQVDGVVMHKPEKDKEIERLKKIVAAQSEEIKQLQNRIQDDADAFDAIEALIEKMKPKQTR